MTIDVDAIAIAIAAKYATVVGPGGATVREATANLPNAITLPATVLVFSESGALVVGSGTRVGAHTFLARFYLEQGVDLETDEVQLRQWVTILLDVWKTGLQLGGIVTVVRTMRWKIGVLTYNRAEYTGIELGLEVITNDAWSPS